MAKLTKNLRVTLQLAADFGTMRVFPEQRAAVSTLAARGLVEHSGTLLQPTATITPAGRAALAKGDPHEL